MAVILIAKIFIELYFFVGVAMQYGEEDLFMSLALPPKNPKGSYWDAISHFTMVKDWDTWRGDPCDMYPFRISALYPNVISMKLFGNSEHSLALWTMILGVGSVLMVGLIGRQLCGAPAGLFSAAILSCIPGHIIYSARVDTDMPQLFYLCLGIYFLISALRAATARGQACGAAASGLSFGLLYLAKLPPALIGLSWALFIPFMLALLRDKETLHVSEKKLRQALGISAVLLCCFLLVVAVENYAYHRLSGHWLLHWRIMKGNAVNIESWRGSKYVAFWPVKLWLPPDSKDLFAHTRMFIDSLFPVGRMGSIYSLAIHGWSGAAFIPALLMLPFVRMRCKKLALTVVLGFICYYVYQEFLWLYPTREDGMLNLTFVHKVHRFIFPCYAGIALCIGAVLGGMWQRCLGMQTRWLKRLCLPVPVCLLCLFAAANYPSTDFFCHKLRGSLSEFRSAIDYLKTVASNGSAIYTATGQETLCRIFEYPKQYSWNYFTGHSMESVCGGWGLVSGFHGVGSAPDTVSDNFPVWLRPYYKGKEGPPPGWRLVKTIERTEHFDAPPMRILKLPDCVKAEK